MSDRTSFNQRFGALERKSAPSVGTLCCSVLAFVFALTWLTGCGGTEEYVPCEGDLVFQIGSGSDFSDAILSATGSTKAEYAHVGIVTIIEGNTFVLEASARDGVVLTSWDDFVEHSPKVGESPGLTVMRVREDFPVAAAVARAMEHLGEPYDWYYMADNGRMYCSELVYDSYLREDGSHIFTAKPMNFRDTDGEMPVFWTDLFSELGEPVPEGELGTNPNDLSRDPALTEVHRFF